MDKRTEWKLYFAIQGLRGFTLSAKYAAVLAYPGFQEIKGSKKALDLSNNIGIELKEIQLVTALYKLTLIISDSELKKLNNSSEAIDQFVYKID